MGKGGLKMCWLGRSNSRKWWRLLIRCLRSRLILSLRWNLWGSKSHNTCLLRLWKWIPPIYSSGPVYLRTLTIAINHIPRTTLNQTPEQPSSPTSININLAYPHKRSSYQSQTLWVSRLAPPPTPTSLSMTTVYTWSLSSQITINGHLSLSGREKVGI
jgi:hypothetical protein